MRTTLLALLCLCGSVVQAQDGFSGRPTFSERDHTAYYVWSEGNHWHVRWVAFSCRQNFKGSVVADRGSIGNMRKVDPVNEQNLIYPQRRQLLTVVTGYDHPANFASNEAHNRDIRMNGKSAVVFSATTDDGLDGFDFTADDAVRTLTFELKLEGKPATGFVYLGKDNVTPGSLPVTVSVGH